MAKSKHLVLGRGEVGKALIEVLSERYDVDSYDKTDGYRGLKAEFDVLHVCIPWSDEFKQTVLNYQGCLVKGGLTIIHSTVPIGTSQELEVVHSPIRGVHPSLADGIRTFAKFFGGKRAKEAAFYFAKLGIKCIVDFDARNTEAGKLWDTTQYGWNIILMHAIKDYCEKNDLNFDLIYTQMNETYNEGYEKMGRSEVRRPVLKYQKGKIGGHCVIPNCHLLQGDIPDFIVNYNERL